MDNKRTHSPNYKRRKLLKTIGTTTLTMGLSPFAIPKKTAASDKKLRILRWKNFIPEFEHWFNNVFAKQWSAHNGIDVIVDNVGMGDIGRLAAAEVKAQQGHDMEVIPQ